MSNHGEFQVPLRAPLLGSQKIPTAPDSAVGALCRSRFQFHTIFSDESAGPLPGCRQVTGPGVVHGSTRVVRTIVHGCRQIISGGVRLLTDGVTAEALDPPPPIPQYNLDLGVHETRALFSCHGFDKSG